MTAAGGARSDRSCPLCAGVSRHDATCHGRDFWRCLRCELTFVAREQQLAAAECLRRYALHENEESEGYVEFLAPARHAVLRHVAPGGRVLDLGCGPGPVLAALLARDGYAVDVHDPLFGHEAAAGPPWDGVVSTEVFEHFAEPARDVARAVERVAPGGVLIVMTLLRPAALPLVDWWYARDPTHVAFYTVRTFEEIARLHGLELLECDGRRLAVWRKPVPADSGLGLQASGLGNAARPG